MIPLFAAVTFYSCSCPPNEAIRLVEKVLATPPATDSVCHTSTSQAAGFRAHALC